MFIKCIDVLPDLSKDILVIPSVSYANIPQLAVDALTETFTPVISKTGKLKITKVRDLVKIGYWHSKYVRPVIGNGRKAFDSDKQPQCSLTLCIEFYRSDNHNIVFMQRRSPLSCHYINAKEEFSKELVNWAVDDVSFQSIILLSSLPSYRRNPIQAHPMAPQYAYFTSNNTCNDINTAINQLGWLKVDGNEMIQEIDSKTMEIKTVKKYGGEITDILFNEFNLRNKQVVGLCYYASEGDNTKEALILASIICIYLDMSKHVTHDSIPYDKMDNSTVILKKPNSWEYVYGAACDY